MRKTRWIPIVSAALGGLLLSGCTPSCGQTPSGANEPLTTVDAVAVGSAYVSERALRTNGRGSFWLYKPAVASLSCTVSLPVRVKRVNGKYYVWLRDANVVQVDAKPEEPGWIEVAGVKLTN